MKTDELIALLATNAGAAAGPAQPAAMQRFAMALGWGSFAAALLMAMLLGVRDDLRAALWLPMFWVKLAFPVSLAVAALVACERLGRPGVRLGGVRDALAAPVIAMWLLALVALAGADDGERTALVFGESWTDCLKYVGLLSVPVWLGSFWAMRGLAPTRLWLAGAAAGLLSGATAAAVYALHCPEMAAPFLGAWYLLGMLIPAAVGALAAPLLLKW